MIHDGNGQTYFREHNLSHSIIVISIHEWITRVDQLLRFVIMCIVSFVMMHIPHNNGEVSLVEGFMPRECIYIKRHDFIVIFILLLRLNFFVVTIFVLEKYSMTNSNAYCGILSFNYKHNLSMNQLVISMNMIFMNVKMLKYCDLGAVSIRKTVLPGMTIPILKIRRPYGRLIFYMEIAICW